MQIRTSNILAKFHANILNLSENIAKSFRGGYFFDSHTVVISAKVCAESGAFLAIKSTMKRHCTTDATK